MNNKKIYSYSGPVLYFDKCVSKHWSAETTAISEKHAKNNLTYRFKKQNNLSSKSKIYLPGKAIRVHET